MDIFYEESSIAQNAASGARKYQILNILSQVFLWIGILMIFIAFMLPFNVLIFWFINVAMFFAIWFVLRRWKMNFNVSYDYCFVSGELRISKVVNINRRKLVARFTTEEMIQIGDIDNPSFERFRSDPTSKTVICTSNVEATDGKFFMYILAEYNGKKLFVLECREELLMHILKFAKRGTLESDYVMQEKKKNRV
ncbi:MAG: hypothetical protein IJZ32_04310 [Clostridia bacterium]|nr:hypothetical protein [Clostridia bacterium]